MKAIFITLSMALFIYGVTMPMVDLFAQAERTRVSAQAYGENIQGFLEGRIRNEKALYESEKEFHRNYILLHAQAGVTAVKLNCTVQPKLIKLQ